MGLGPKVKHKMNPYGGNYVGNVSLSVGAEAGDAIVVTATVKDQQGKVVTERVALDWYLSGAATGASVVSTAPSAGVSDGAAGDVQQTVTGKVGVLITDASGVCNLSIGEASTGTWYLVVRLPDGRIVVSGAITFV